MSLNTKFISLNHKKYNDLSSSSPHPHCNLPDDKLFFLLSLQDELIFVTCRLQIWNLKPESNKSKTNFNVGSGVKMSKTIKNVMLSFQEGRDYLENQNSDFYLSTNNLYASGKYTTKSAMVQVLFPKISLVWHRTTGIGNPVKIKLSTHGLSMIANHFSVAGN